MPKDEDTTKVIGPNIPPHVMADMWQFMLKTSVPRILAIHDKEKAAREKQGEQSNGEREFIKMKPKKITGFNWATIEMGKQWGYQVGNKSFYIGETSNQKYRTFTLDHGVENNDYRNFSSREAAREYLGKNFKELKGKRFYILN